MTWDPEPRLSLFTTFVVMRRAIMRHAAWAVGPLWDKDSYPKYMTVGLGLILFFFYIERESIDHRERLREREGDKLSAKIWLIGRQLANPTTTWVPHLPFHAGAGNNKTLIVMYSIYSSCLPLSPFPYPFPTQVPTTTSRDPNGSSLAFFFFPF